MPLYDYECRVCGERFEELTASDCDTAQACPACGKAEGRRLPSTPVSRMGKRFPGSERLPASCHPKRFS